jgi:hypothetical protein
MTTLDTRGSKELPDYQPHIYKYNRIKEYPQNIIEQLDMIWHDIDDGKFGENGKTGNWYLTIKAIKTKYPKPE